ncbi:FIST C-terminal domain-containing protein [Thalassococcus sp. CAU 1522]|uniref:FIST C-terminal domain-containing protein n=1 Tax=Thalassococcus arenae TaxID=2851652 RepID=A0ABS6NA68_9RHOB|nr:FIST C-terminal domain-containing protein [Thalassococcus arenae]
MAEVACTAVDPLREIKAQLGAGPFALVCLFASPRTDFRALVQATAGGFGDADVLACTTAGELGRGGYADGLIIAVAFPADLYAVSTVPIDNLGALDAPVLMDMLIRKRMALTQRAADMPFEFGFLMVDGLSQREENLTEILASGLGPMPLFGGSAGDGADFSATWLAHNGRIRQNAASLALIRSRCPVRVFSLDHLRPTETRMVVTAADPDNRIVHEINAEPAALEYARLLGKDPEQLDPFTFAAHPVVVRLGDSHHVRSIRMVGPNNELYFFSAINEGMVLTLATHDDMVTDLDRGLTALAAAEQPEQILGCDCLLRRIEAEQTQKSRAVSDILVRHNVIGFSTYGEQIGALHVNQTLTGVAIYPPLQTAPG